MNLVHWRAECCAQSPLIRLLVQQSVEHQGNTIRYRRSTRAALRSVQLSRSTVASVKTLAEPYRGFDRRCWCHFFNYLVDGESSVTPLTQHFQGQNCPSATKEVRILAVGGVFQPLPSGSAGCVTSVMLASVRLWWWYSLTQLLGSIQGFTGDRFLITLVNQSNWMETPFCQFGLSSMSMCAWCRRDLGSVTALFITKPPVIILSCHDGMAAM